MESKKVKIQNMDISNPIDVETAIRGLGGEKSIFIMMLSKLEAMTLNNVMASFIKAYDD